MLTFRPHHFLCTLGFQGKGYSPGFVKNFEKIASMLRAKEGEETLIQVTGETDSICAPCPHRLEKRCEQQAKIDQLDTAHAMILGLKTGDIITWKEAKERLAKQMTVEKFHQACEGCEWKRYGVCEEALKNIKT